MDLLLGQLVYTSFTKIGFKTLASEQVPTEIQEAFMDHVVGSHWDPYKLLPSEYRAVFLYQVTQEHSLFGWLYNDGVDDLGRSHVPYFICYYLAEPLYAFLLENICTFLHKGPVELIDRHSLPFTLKDLIVPDLWEYQPARPGVLIPWDVRKQIHTALKQGELINIFVPFNEEVVIEVKNEYQPQKFVTKEQNASYDSLPQNSILLLGVSLGFATSLALAISTYGFFQIISIPNSPGVTSSEISPTFYQTLAKVPNVPQGVFKYAGSTIFRPLQSKTIVSAINQAQPQFQLRLVNPINSQPDSSTEIAMLIAGKLSFAQSSRYIKNTEFFEANERGFKLGQIPIAMDGVVFYVNPKVSIPGLTLEQLKNIFSGKITNWKALGGPDLKITIFSSVNQSNATVDILNAQVLAEEKITTTVQKVKNNTEAVNKVAQIPGGISYSTVPEVTGQKNVYPLSLSIESGQNFVSPFVGVNQSVLNKTAFLNGSYPLARKLFVLVKYDSSIDEQAGIAYVNLLLSDEGQNLVAKAGFVPIR